MNPIRNSVSRAAANPWFRPGWRLLALQFGLLLLITVIFSWNDLDRTISGIFYDPEGGWFLGREPLWYWLYRYGTIPGVVLALGALLVWLASFFAPRLDDWRRPCLVVVLTTVLGAGLLVNSVLKQYWGRPRPSQTVTYGGNWEYRPIFPPGTPGQGASFPCGHCTMGFVFVATAAFHRRSRRLALGGVATGLVLGGLLSAARIVQGAHFPSDTIWSLGIIAMTATALTAYLPQPKDAQRSRAAKPRTRGRKLLLAAGSLLALALVAGGFLTRRPFYSTYTYPFELPAGTRSLQVTLDADAEKFAVDYAPGAVPQLRVDVHGFGWINFDYRLEFASRPEGDALHLRLDHAARSYFAELDHALTLTLPESARDTLRPVLRPGPDQ